jgi:hypothetical protein
MIMKSVLSSRSIWQTISALAITVSLTGCAGLTVMQTNQIAGAALTGLAARSPTTELEQIYYLGIFDPQEQLPPMFYRVRVRGQGGALGATSFASGWAPAGVIDSLGGSVQLSPANGNTIPTVAYSKATPEAETKLDLAKRLMLFGPEGFREAPRNHRLVIVMGHNPSAFFNAVDEALGTVASAIKPAGFRGLDFSVSNFLLELKTDQEGLSEVLAK